MTDKLTKMQRSYLMSQVRPVNSRIELLVFSHLRKLHIHFLKHYKKVPGTPDIARPLEKKAVFIHSDFWHGWRFPTWSHKLPSDFWRQKISMNRARDQKKLRQLRSSGWSAMVVWEHSLKREPEATLSKIAAYLER
jgi:DNA mismatch endonuclease (patch repair protein)